MQQIVDVDVYFQNQDNNEHKKCIYNINISMYLLELHRNLKNQKLDEI